MYITNDATKAIPNSTHSKLKKLNCPAFSDACKKAGVNVKSATNYLHQVRKAAFPAWKSGDTEGGDWWVRGNEDRLLSAVEGWHMTALGNEMFTQPWFDGDEQDVLAEYLAFTSSLGFPLQRDEFLCKVNVAVKEKANERGVRFTPLGRNWFYD